MVSNLVSLILQEHPFHFRDLELPKTETFQVDTSTVSLDTPGLTTGDELALADKQVKQSVNFLKKIISFHLRKLLSANL